MGDKTQRVNGLSREKDAPRPVGRPPKDKRKSSSKLKKHKEKEKEKVCTGCSRGIIVYDKLAQNKLKQIIFTDTNVISSTQA